MFKAQLKEASLLKKVFDAIKDLVVDANFICTDEGIQMQAMDQSHVTLITLTLLAEGFTSYECPDTFTLGLKIPLFSKILKCVENTDSITLEAHPDSDSLLVSVESTNGARNCMFELNRIDLDSNTVELPDTEYAYSLKMPCNNFKKLMSDLSALGENCTIEIKDNEASFNVRGDVGKAKITIQKDTTSKHEEDHTIIDMSSEDPFKQMYSMKYLSYFAKTTGISDQVGIYMSEGVPLFVTYDMGEVGSVGFYLAPKIEDE
jgi:proliferating cell nuclear antigen